MAPMIFFIFLGYFLYNFIKNPQTRNARAFLPLNISVVGSEASTLTYLTKHQVLLIKEKCDQSLKT